jgi:hypothetical protein
MHQQSPWIKQTIGNLLYQNKPEAKKFIKQFVRITWFPRMNFTYVFFLFFLDTVYPLKFGGWVSLTTPVPIELSYGICVLWSGLLHQIMVRILTLQYRISESLSTLGSRWNQGQWPRGNVISAFQMKHFSNINLATIVVLQLLQIVKIVIQYTIVLNHHCGNSLTNQEIFFLLWLHLKTAKKLSTIQNLIIDTLIILISGLDILEPSDR